MINTAKNKTKKAGATKMEFALNKEEREFLQKTEFKVSGIVKTVRVNLD